MHWHCCFIFQSLNARTIVYVCSDLDAYSVWNLYVICYSGVEAKVEACDTFACSKWICQYQCSMLMSDATFENASLMAKLRIESRDGLVLGIIPGIVWLEYTICLLSVYQERLVRGLWASCNNTNIFKQCRCCVGFAFGISGEYRDVVPWDCETLVPWQSSRLPTQEEPRCNQYRIPFQVDTICWTSLQK